MDRPEAIEFLHQKDAILENPAVLSQAIQAYVTILLLFYLFFGFSLTCVLVV